MYAQQSAWGTETERIIEWLQPQALKRFLSVTYTTFLYVVFALKQNRTIPVIPFVSKLTVKPGSIRSGFGTERKTEYPVTDLIISKTKMPNPPGWLLMSASCSFSHAPSKTTFG